MKTRSTTKLLTDATRELAGRALPLLWAASAIATLLVLGACSPAERPVVDEESFTEDVADVVPAEPPELQILSEHPEVYRLLHGDPKTVLLEARLKPGEEASLPDTDGTWAVLLDPASVLQTDAGGMLEAEEGATATRLSEEATSIRAGDQGAHALVLTRTGVELADAAVGASPDRFLDQLDDTGARTLYRSDALVIVQTTLAPGAELPAVPYERLLYTRSGGTVETETATGETRRHELSEGEVLHRGPSDLKLVNTGDAEVEAVLFWLLPTDTDRGEVPDVPETS